MLALPVEVVCGGILPYLSVCDLQALDTAFTNKYLRPKLQRVWKSYQYDSANAKLKAGDVVWLRGVDICIISLTVIYITALNDIITNIPKTLKKLCIEVYIHSTVVENLAANCLGLVELYVICVGGPNTDNAVSALAQNCRQLHTLRMNSSELTDAGLSSLAQYGNQLHILHIGDAPISDAGIQALCDNCPYLKHIDLDDCYNLTDASLLAITNSYPHLESISLYSNNFTDDGLIYIADKCHELRSVSVKCDNITSRGLTALWAANANIMDVDISHNRYIADDDIIQLVQCCPLLQKIKFVGCKQITDAAVIAVAEHCPQLRSFDISYCYELSDASLIALGQHCRELKSINISDLENISDVGIAALAAGCPLLQEFYAGDANNKTTDAGVIALARGCRDLRKINISWCQSIGIAAVTAMAENCPLISELDLSHCPNVDDACLCVIAQHCHNFSYLNVYSTTITDISVLNSGRMSRVIWSCCL